MTQMLPITPLPVSAERHEPEPLAYQFAAKAFLSFHKARELGPEGAARYAELHWERVRLVCASPDDDDAFYACGRPYLALNPDDFGIAVWRHTQPMVMEAEPWQLVPPDVPASPEPYVEPASEGARRCVWCAVTVGCVIFWATVAAVAVTLWGGK